MATKTSRKVRASSIHKGMTLAENGKPIGKVIKRSVHTYHPRWPSMSWSVISFELDGTTDIIHVAASPSEWVEVMRDKPLVGRTFK